jgi:hypothetical protein
MSQAGVLRLLRKENTLTSRPPFRAFHFSFFFQFVCPFKLYIFANHVGNELSEFFDDSAHTLMQLSSNVMALINKLFPRKFRSSTSLNSKSDTCLLTNKKQAKRGALLEEKKNQKNSQKVSTNEDIIG